MKLMILAGNILQFAYYYKTGTQKSKRFAEYSMHFNRDLMFSDYLF